METIMNFMAKDHDRLDSLFTQFRNLRNTDVKKAKGLFHEFKIGLQRHIVWEEEILFPLFVWIMLWIFLMAGIGNAATFRQYPIVFAFSPRQGAQILGWTGAWAAYGPFIFSSLIGAAITAYGSAKPFFWGALAFYAIATWINWNYYTKPGAERFDWGTKWGTWWDKAKHTWQGADKLA